MLDESQQRMEEKLKDIIWIQKSDQEPGRLLIYREQEQRLWHMEEHSHGQRPRIILVRGKKGCGRKFLMRHLAWRRKQNVLFADMEALYQCCLEEGSAVIQILNRMAAGMHAILCITVGEKEEKEERWSELLYGMVLERISCYVLTDRMVSLPAEGMYEQAEIHLEPPDIAQRVELWDYFLKQYHTAAGIDASFLAGRYILNAGGIERALRSARLYQDGENRSCMAESDIVTAVRSYQNDRFSAYAGRIPTSYAWEDLVVAQEVEARLKELCNQVTYRSLVGNQWGFYEKKPYGRGITALFHGPSGTGKTMAAQIIAGELGLELYRVDLSQMMSKYIGETQKNISTLFDQAEDMNVLLLFDEADAFFSKRTGVKDSHDRHSNGEVAHLLQKMEDYEGISILTTNLKDNMDEAFKRRIKIMVEFQLPDAGTRKLLWRKVLPEKAPVGPDLNLDFFGGQFQLSGSEIQETMLNAAFLAAADGGRIENRHVAAALRECYLKYGKILLKEELICQ